MASSKDSSSSSPSESQPSTSDHVVLHDDVQHEQEGEGEEGRSVLRDIRRYYCEYCGICRSKKSLIRSHVLVHHKDEMLAAQDSASNTEKEDSEHVSHTCQECGANFRKLAYLKQHMQSHSLEELGF